MSVPHRLALFDRTPPIEDLIEPPLVYLNLAICASREFGVTGVNLDTGKVAWTLATKAHRSVCRLWNGLLVVSPRPDVIAFAEPLTGEVVRVLDSEKLAGPVLDFSAIAADLLMCPKISGGICAWSLTTGDLLWQNDCGWIESSLVASDHLVFVAERHAYVAFALQTGKEVWRLDVTELGRHSRILVGEQPGESSGWMVVAGDVFIAGISGGWIVALDAVTGSMQWKMQAGPLPPRSFAIGPKGRLIALTMDTLLISDLATGAETNRRRIAGQVNQNGDGPFSPPAIDEDIIWTADREGVIVAIAIDDATIAARIPTGGRISRALVIAGETLLGADDSGRLFMLSGDRKPLVETPVVAD